MTIKSTLRLRYPKLSSMSGWDIAKRFGLDYDGDASPIPHGGLFYRITETTIDDGYVDAVRLDDVDDMTCIDDLTVNLPADWETLCHVCQYADIPMDGIDRNGHEWAPETILRAIVWACSSYGLYDVNHTAWVETEEPRYKEKRYVPVERMTENQALNLCMQWIGVQPRRRK